MFLKMKTAVIVIFLLITARAHAQTTIVEGKVTDGKESLPGVTVYTDEKNATGTDADGNY